MNIKIPKLSLVVLVGPSGAGKSTFAQKHFLSTEVISSDVCRGILSDDENDQSVSKEAFELLEYITEKRLTAGKLTVIDATNVQQQARAPFIHIARKKHCIPVAIVLNIPEKICQERNRNRENRQFGNHVVRNQCSQLRRTVKKLKREGFRHVFILNSPEEVDAVVIERVPLWNDKSDEKGPFDFIGDIHGCCDELEELLELLGYQRREIESGGYFTEVVYEHPENRKAVFVGDLVDRGPRILDTVNIVRNMINAGSALCVPGNHDMKLMRHLKNGKVQITHGLADSIAEIEAIPEEFKEEYCKDLYLFLDSMISHYVLNDGKIVVAHAGMKEKLQGRGSGRVRDFALYGETSGETDEFGLPVRHNWAADYRGSAIVVYGHTPVPHPEWINNTINIDTGAVFGGKLTALRFPEEELVSVSARKIYCKPSRPFLEEGEQAPGLSTQHLLDDILDAKDVIGKRIISTRLSRNITIQAENATAALEVMSRFAANPKWLIYLPPTMSPCETSTEPGLLEHPAQAFSYYRNQGTPFAICEEKHMGSRAVMIVCRDSEVSRKRFGITEDETGIIYTRTGRRFFKDQNLEEQILERTRCALNTSGFWDKFNTDWVCFDCELMPWSAKAQELLEKQYGSVGAAGNASLPSVVDALSKAANRMEDSELEKYLSNYENKHESLKKFVDAYRQYCWTVDSIDDYKIAPFHILATEGAVHVNQNHLWHMENIANVCKEDPELLLATNYHQVDLTNPESIQKGIEWWNELTGKGGEGMVVKPLDFITRGKRGISQPAVKCRGPEYLRIIYGPDYQTEENLSRLRKRGLGRKRSLASREFILGIEGLERFIRNEPLRRIHECVFGVLALESEPVDPRL